MIFKIFCFQEICRFAFKIPYYVTLTFTFLYNIYRTCILSDFLFILSWKELIRFSVYHQFLRLSDFSFNLVNRNASAFLCTNREESKDALYFVLVGLLNIADSYLLNADTKVQKHGIVQWRSLAGDIQHSQCSWRLFAELGITGKLKRTAVKNLGTAAERSSCCIWLKRIDGSLSIIRRF